MRAELSEDRAAGGPRAGPAAAGHQGVHRGADGGGRPRRRDGLAGQRAARLSSGTPAIGVGAGNVPVIVDETADLAAAAPRSRPPRPSTTRPRARRRTRSMILDAVYESAIAALKEAGGYMCTPDEKRAIRRRSGSMASSTANSSPGTPTCSPAPEVGLSEAAQRARFFMVEETGVGREHPFSGEKLGLVLDRVPRTRLRGAKSSGCGRSWSTRARAIPAASTPATWRGRESLPRSWTWCACWSTSPTPSATAAASTRASISRSAWAAAPGRGTRSQREPQLPALPQHHPSRDRRSPRTSRARRSCSAPHWANTASGGA